MSYRTIDKPEALTADESDQNGVSLSQRIKDAETALLDSLSAVRFEGLNSFERKQIHEYFEENQEFRVKTYREDDDVILKVYPVGTLKRLAEEKAQESLMNGRAVELPPMGSFERFVIHDYLKGRDGIKTASIGQNGKDRRIVITPMFGRHPRKARNRRLM